MKTEYEKDLQQAWLIIEADSVYEEDYQMRMLKKNQPQGILPVLGQGKNEKSRYRYDINGKISMKSKYEQNTISYQDMERFMKQFIKVLKEVQNYLLETEKLILDPEYIFCSEEEFYFCYYPAAGSDIREEFHKLTEYFVKKADYDDKDGIYLAYELHRSSMEENYGIEQILDSALERKEKELQDIYKTGYETEEDTWVDDWIGAQEMTGYGVNERRSVWGYVKHAFRMRKKNKWGEWDDVEDLEEQQ